MSKQAQVLFLLGPSGVGKTTLGNALEKHLGMLHILFDGASGGDGVDVAHLRTEWNALLEAKNPQLLADEARKRIRASGHTGVVISCPGGVMPAEDNRALPWHFSRLLLAKMEECGVRCVTLFGSLKLCCDAAVSRKDTSVTVEYWLQNNSNWHGFDARAFSNVVLEVFNSDGSRRDLLDLVGEIQERFLK